MLLIVKMVIDFHENETLELLTPRKDACMVKPGFKPVPQQLYFEFATLFLNYRGKKSGKFKIKLWRNWFEFRFYCASIFKDQKHFPTIPFFDETIPEEKFAQKGKYLLLMCCEISDHIKS